MIWPFAGHLVFALGAGFAATNYPAVISPQYAAILGTFVLYPVMVIMWWHLHRPDNRRG